MRSVCYNRKYVLHKVQEVRLEELCSCFMVGKLLQEGEENIEPNVCYVPHRVFECPDNSV